jgi:hypothetical protein
MRGIESQWAAQAGLQQRCRIVDSGNSLDGECRKTLNQYTKVTPVTDKPPNAIPLEACRCPHERDRRGLAAWPPRGWRKRSGVVVLGSTVVLVSAVVVGAVGAWTRTAAVAPISVANPRVVVLKSKRVVHLLDGKDLVRTYPIDLGVSPAGQKRRQGDGRTPEGAFHVVTKNANSEYHRFVGIDYPDDAAVERGLAQGLVSIGEASSIRSALRDGQCPDWGTALGGGIGIHGGRTGRDTTGGCIALLDKHIDELFSVLRIGDPIEIRP